jgi:catechol 2,3-dioxygenase-like lactoylglutathione lyase family enzyme
MRLHLAMLFVKDLARMTEFYGETLGLKRVSSSEGWVEFELFALHEVPAAIAEGISTSPREDAPAKLIFSVESLESEYQRLIGLGVPLSRRPWGAFDGVDPEGNIFQVCGV